MIEFESRMPPLIVVFGLNSANFPVFSRKKTAETSSLMTACTAITYSVV